MYKSLQNTLKFGKSYFSSSQSIYTILILKQGFIQLLGIFSGIFLTRVLTVSEYGTYATYAFVFYLLVSFGDLGIGASIISRQDSPSDDQYASIPLLYMLLGICYFFLFFLALVAGDFFVIWIFQDYIFFLIIPFAYMLYGFQVVPTIKLEKQLQFNQIALLEVTQTVLYNAALVTMVLLGYRYFAFSFSWFLFSMVGALFAHTLIERNARIISLLREKLIFMKLHIRNGIAYQLHLVVNFIKNNSLPLIVGSTIGVEAVGQLSWAYMLTMSTTIGLLVLQRLYYPSFSRALKDENSSVKELFEKYIILSNAINLPFAVCIYYFMEPITIFVFGTKWIESVPYAKIFWLNSLILPTYAVVSSFLQANNESKWVFKLTLVSISFQILAGFLSLKIIGIEAYPITILLSNLILCFSFKKVSSLLSFQTCIKTIIHWCVGLALVSIVSYLHFSNSGLLNLLSTILLYFIIYGLLTFLIYRSWFTSSHV